MAAKAQQLMCVDKVNSLKNNTGVARGRIAGVKRKMATPKGDHFFLFCEEEASADQHCARAHCRRESAG
jgi:cob(I)alamin adenosyltransferase